MSDVRVAVVGTIGACVGALLAHKMSEHAAIIVIGTAVVVGLIFSEPRRLK